MNKGQVVLDGKPNDVFNYFEMISIANKSFVKFNRQKTAIAPSNKSITAAG